MTKNTSASIRPGDDLNESELFTALQKFDSSAKGKSRRDFIQRLIELGVPKELAYRLGELWKYTKEVHGKSVKMGRIVLAHIIEFIESHPHVIAGMALGAALAVLVAHIPILGPHLAGTVALLAIPIGAATGAKVDTEHKREKNESSGKYERIAEQLVRLAHDFFRMLIRIFKCFFVAA